MQITVNGRRLYAEIAGQGSPTLVLETGAGMESTTWEPIWPDVTRMTTALRYDRAGLGRSDPPPAPLTAAAAAEDLHALLREAGVTAPLILAGHSFGGLVVRLFAHRWPDLVAGVLLIDSSHPEQRRRGLAALPLPAPGEHPAVTGMRKRYQSEDDEIAKSLAEVAAIGGMGAIPLVVLSRGRSARPELGPASEAVWQEMQRDLARLSTNSTHLIVPGAGHTIHQDAPEAVIQALANLCNRA